MREAPELVGALAAIVAVTIGWRALEPDPGALAGHAFGVVGLLLMLATEVLYSVRKRSTGRAWGPTRSWLQWHVFTGVVGPYLVLLHASWRFAGLAGWAALATVVVTASGFLGRYLYTALPRTARARRLLAIWHAVHVPLGAAMFVLVFAHVIAAIWFGARLE